MTGTFLAVLLMAGFIERFIEPILSPIPVIGQYMRYNALLLGIVLAMAMGLDVVSPVMTQLGAGSTMLPFVGQLMTGIILGSGSSAVHDWLKAVTEKKEVS